MGQIERALDAPSADIRLFLLHGPDDAGSQALTKRLERAMGPDAERIDLDGAALKIDPARLADEARSEEHTSELQSLMRISYAVFCLKKTKQQQTTHTK